MTTDSHTTLHVEAALCLWEAMIEHREKFPDLDAAWDRYGTVEMRHAAIRLGADVCRVWDLLDEDQRYHLIPYDWEFVPSLLDKIEWTYPATLSPEEAALALIMTLDLPTS